MILCEDAAEGAEERARAGAGSPLWAESGQRAEKDRSG